MAQLPRLGVWDAGQAGLELCAGKGLKPDEAMKKGVWCPADPKPGAITVNIGDAV